LGDRHMICVIGNGSQRAENDPKPMELSPQLTR
jgi:hypothetical protein